MKRERLCCFDTIVVLALLVISAAVQQAWAQAVLNPTDDARLHCAVVDGITGSPAKGAALRLIGPPRLVVFQPEKVQQLAKETHLFADNPVYPCDGKGVVSMRSPLDLAPFMGLFDIDQGHVVAAAPNADPLVAKAGVNYRRVEITGRYMFVSGKVYAAYLAPFAVVPYREGEAPPKAIRSVAELSVQVQPEVAKAGETVSVTVEWRLVKMPLMQSSVKVGEKEASRLSGGEGDGRVTEVWKAADIPVLPSVGRHKLTVEAYLDSPFKTIPAARSEALYYVVGSQEEAVACKQVLGAMRLDASKNQECIAICRNAVERFPDLGVAWAELGKRLAAEGKWQDILAAWEKAPDSAKNMCALAASRGVAIEKLGKKDETDDTLLAVVRCDDAPAVARMVAFGSALREEKWGSALQMVEYLKDDMNRRTFVDAKRFLSWLNGDRSSSGFERLFVIMALEFNGQPDEALAALSEVAPERLKDDAEREHYYRLAVRLYLHRKMVDDAQRLGTVMEQRFGRDKAVVALVLGTIAEAKGDLSAALGHFAEAKYGRDCLEAYARVLQRSFEVSPPEDGVKWACAAMSLLAAHEFDGARRMAKEATKRAPKLAAAHLAHGLALELSGRLGEAVESLKTAAELAPDNEYVAKEYQWSRTLAASGRSGRRTPNDDSKPPGPAKNAPDGKPVRSIRTWIDTTGKYKVQAKLAGVDKNQVRLEKSPGKTIVAVPLDRLSTLDQKYVSLVESSGGSSARP